MSSTDDPRGDEERGEEPIEESVLPPGPRRSTYTPPVPRQPAEPALNDDELADLIAANLASATGAINVVYQLDDVEPSLPMGAPVEQLAAPPPGARILPKDEAATPPTAATEPPAASMPSPDASAVPADLPPPPEFASPSLADAPPPVFSAPPPVFNAPPPVFDAPPPVFDAPPPVFDAPPPVFDAPPPDFDAPPPVFDISPPEATPGLDEPAEELPIVEESVYPAFSDLDEETTTRLNPPAWAIDEETTSREPEREPEPEPEPESGAQRVDPEPFQLPVIPPAPPTDPVEQAAFLAASAAPSGQRPWIPERQSLRDDELAALVESGAEHPGGTLGMMEELERQMQLREDETREFKDWQDSMLAVGTPEALAAVQDVLPDFADIVAPATSSIPVAAPPTPEPSVFDAPPPAFDAPPPSGEPSAYDAPPPVGEPSVLDAPPPAGEPSAFDAPPPAFDAPPPSGEPSVFDVPPPFDAPPPVVEEPTFFDAPPPAVVETLTFDAPPPVIEEPPVFDAPPPVVDEPTSFDAPPPSFAPEPLPETEGVPEPIDEIPVFATAAVPPPLVEPPSVPDAWDIPAGTAYNDPTDADPIFIEPVPAEPQPLVEPAPFGGDPFVDRVFTGSVPVITGSVQIAPQQLDVDGDDPVDPTDQVPAAFDDLLGAHPGTAPVEPILSPRIPEDEVVLGEAQQLERPRVFSLEAAGLEPTPTEQRVGRAARMFWMWFAANSSIVSIAFGAVLFSLGLSLRQAIVGILAGVAVSFLPLGLGTLAGKRSGQPTMVVSRAAFGVVGNSIPAFIGFVSRVFWGAGMLWLLGVATSEILTGAELTGGLGESLLVYIAIGVGLVLALVVALFGYGMLAKFQLVVSVLSGILVIGVIALTFSYVDLSAALTNRDGSWFLAATVAVLVFSFIGLLWANSVGDLARYQRVGSSGAGAMLWTSFGAAVPTFVLISYGALLAASNPQIADGLLTVPFDTIGRLLPVWYPVPLIAATALSLVSGIIVTVYSGGFALKAVGVSLGRPVAAVITAVLVGGGALGLTVISADLTMLFRDLATTLAVPVAAWAGIFAADTMIRNRRYHAESLLTKGGIYPTVHWVNVPALLVITAAGFGLTTATVAGLDWQGFLWPLLGVPLDSALAATDIGVFAALLLGLLVPIVSGIPGIRRQEAATPPEN
jgi:purine-cytosine permease-like protein